MTCPSQQDVRPWLQPKLHIRHAEAVSVVCEVCILTNIQMNITAGDLASMVPLPGIAMVHNYTQRAQSMNATMLLTECRAQQVLIPIIYSPCQIGNACKTMQTELPLCDV